MFMGATRIVMVAGAAVLCAASASSRQQAPQPIPAGTGAGGVSVPKCELVTETVPIESLTETIDGATDEEIYRAAIQFLVTAGTQIESSDPVSRTFVTKLFTGQTIQSTCRSNWYRAYRFRVAVVGKRMIVNMDCRGSFGFESYVSNGTVIPAYRGNVEDCSSSSKTDAVLQPQLVEGTRAILGLSAAP